MNSALTVDRWQFAFTITFHYLFPQLTMGLALLIVVLKTIALRREDEHYNKAARFWAKIFAINFAIGVVTGIPMEFQFGTNWSRFSAAAGGVIGHTLAMEGVFSFFLESTFLGLFLFGETRLGARGHWFAAFMVLVGSWLSGFLIVATNAWMQHPVAFERATDGSMTLASFWGLLGNPWLAWQYAHTMLGAVITGCFVMASIGAFYLLHGSHMDYGRTFLRAAVCVGLPAAVLAAFPTGDGQAKMVARHQPVTFAAMEGVFETEHGASLVLVGQPDVENRRLDNPIAIPRALSFLTHNRWTAEVKGLDDFPEADWPDNVALLYFAYHVMAGLGTIFMAALGAAAWLLWRGRLFTSRWMLWVLMLLLPFPYIANTAGWMTAELGRQPWIVHGLMRTSDASSPSVSAGNALFTLIGFMGMYTVLGILFLFLVYKRSITVPIRRGNDVQIVWFCLVAAMIVMYVILDGFDLGAGIVQAFAARTDAEKRLVLKSIGPVWDGNEVWLLAAGGTLFFAFPKLYAASFSGFYLPLMIVLWLLMLRGISIEFRSHVAGAVWRPFWDFVFGGSSLLLTLFFGAALGNVVRGVPLDASGHFFEPLWTHFGITGRTGILDWYTVLVGLVALATLTAHGALWVAWKTDGDLSDRCRRVALRTWWGIAALIVGVTAATLRVQPLVSASLADRPWGYAFPVIAVAALLAVRSLAKRRLEGRAFLASCVFIAAMLASVVFGLYPYVLPARPESSAAFGLTVHNASAAEAGLRVGLAWWIPGIALATLYFTFLYRRFAGKVHLEERGY